MDTNSIVDAAIAQDADAFMAAFNAAIMPRVSTALEVKKVEVASSLLTPEEAHDEIPEITAEVDGSDAGDTAAAEQSAEAESAA